MQNYRGEKWIKFGGGYKMQNILLQIFWMIAIGLVILLLFLIAIYAKIDGFEKRYIKRFERLLDYLLKQQCDE